jgi:hypothetical protein
MRTLAIAALLALGCSAPDPAPPSATECVSCHVEDYRRADPPHPGVRPDTCGVCHTQDGWHPDVLQHEWPLTGTHLTTGCFDCHDGTPPVFDGTPTECVGCHADDERTRTFPAHHTFGTDCASCHNTTAFRPATHHPEPPDAGPPDTGHVHAHHPATEPPTTTTHHTPPPTTTHHTPPPTTRTPPPTTRTPPPTTRTPDPTPPPDTTTRASRRY